MIFSVRFGYCWWLLGFSHQGMFQVVNTSCPPKLEGCRVVIWKTWQWTIVGNMFGECHGMLKTWQWTIVGNMFGDCHGMLKTWQWTIVGNMFGECHGMLKTWQWTIVGNMFGECHGMLKTSFVDFVKELFFPTQRSILFLWQ